jgi:hypothetical protein
MHNETIIIVVLVILLIIVIFTIMKRRESFVSEIVTCPDGSERLPHNKANCSNFIDDGACNNVEDIPDIHVNSSPIDNNRNIHYVNPHDPCCLRSCINDFTYTDEDELTGGKQVGDYRQNIPVHMLYSSRCAQCLLKFETALTMLKSPDTCPQSE